MTAEEKYGAALQRALDARAVEPIAAKEDDETSHYSLDHSRDGTLSSSVRADMKANARPVLDRWKVYDQERELSPLASGGNAAIVFAVPANEKSLRSVSVGDPLPDAGPNYSNRIVEMRRRMDQIRSLEKGDLGPGNCKGAKMPKRLFDNATNDSPPAIRGRTDGPGDRNGRKSLKRPLDNTENDAENDFPPSKRAREDHNTSSCQQLAEDATGDPMDVDDPGDQPSSWTKSREQLPPGSWKDNGMDGYDGENSGGFWSTQTLQAILDSRIDYAMDDYQGENMDGIE